MYKIMIGVDDKGKPTLAGTTESKGEARAVASFCNRNKVLCLVYRQAAEVEVKYTFTPPAKK